MKETTKKIDNGLTMKLFWLLLKIPSVLLKIKISKLSN